MKRMMQEQEQRTKKEKISSRVAAEMGAEKSKGAKSRFVDHDLVSDESDDDLDEEEGEDCMESAEEEQHSDEEEGEDSNSEGEALEEREAGLE